MMIEDIRHILTPQAQARVAWCGFDHDWYVLAYPEVLNEVDDASFDLLLAHYIQTGRARGYAPNMYFDELWYQQRYRDVANEIASGQVGSGYEHYCAIGYLSKSPHWLYDDDVYAAASPDLDEATLLQADCFNRYDHYLKIGARERREAHKLFDPNVYMSTIAQAGGKLEGSKHETAGPFGHYLRQIWDQRRDFETSAYFDPDWYVSRYEVARNAIDAGQVACALHHYLVVGLERGGRDPCPEFSEDYYLDRYPDVAAAVRDGVFQSGYEHFLKSGVFDLRAPSAAVDLREYLQDHAEARVAIAKSNIRDAFAHLRGASTAKPAGAMQTGLAVSDARARDALRGEGRVDFFGYHAAAHGWFFCGWLSPEHPALTAEINGDTSPEDGFQAIAYFEMGQIEGPLTLSSYFRPDLSGNGIGVIIYLEGSGHALGRLVSLNVSVNTPALGQAAWTAYPAEGAPMLRDSELVAPLRPILGQLTANSAKALLVGLAMRQGYTGANTLADLHERVLLELDEVIYCPPHGLLLIGWMLAHPGVVTALRIHSGAKHHMLTQAQFATIERPDVLQSVGVQYGFQTLNNGFIAYVPDTFTPGETAYIAVETRSGEVAYRGIPEPRLRGMDAMRFALDRVDARHGELVRIADSVLGPALTSLNRARLSESKGYQRIVFGTPDPAPELSVIVPLYGRLDFMEYQFAFAARPQAADAGSRNVGPAIAHEYIYVLDDPRLRRQAEQLGASIFARFGIPFQLVVLQHNLGFAPANNVALSLARGRFVGFMNSDVFPGSPDWMARLVARLDADPALGAVGPMLLFEDGSVQHIGMVFEPVPAFGNWLFPMHEQKGWRPPSPDDYGPRATGSDAGGLPGLRPCTAITGACIVLSRALAIELGGFDEDYIIGDFEDADLCMKLAARGLACAVDIGVRLYHLERQSQAAPDQRWRMNLTLHNAWVHETRWGTRLRAAALSADAAPATDVLDVVTDQTPDQTPGQTSGQTSGQIPGEAVIQSTVAQAAGTDATPPSSEAPAAKPLARGKRGVLTAKTRTQGARKPPAKSPA